jgi:hypothetical protein
VIYNGRVFVFVCVASHRRERRERRAIVRQRVTFCTWLPGDVTSLNSGPNLTCLLARRTSLSFVVIFIRAWKLTKRQYNRTNVMHFLFTFFEKELTASRCFETTGYGLDGPRIESRWGEIFRACPDRPWGPHSLLYNGYRVFPGDNAAGAWRWPLTPSSGEV